MADQFENRHIDKRVAHRYLKKAVIDEKDFERHIKSLPDLADQAVAIEAAMEGEPDEDADE
jgi:hypothetical protein